jgi:hypothetical protein
MPPSVEDQVIDFYYDLFDRIFSDAFRPVISDRLRRDTVKRQVDEAAAASSQSLTRFLLNQQLGEQQVADILAGLSPLANSLELGDISNPNVTPESLVENLLDGMPCPDSVESTGCGPVYRVALHSLVQTLMLVGPVMAEWRRLGFSTTFELPRRVVNRLNEISAQMAAMGTAGQAAADERYELSYRDYLLQRFNRVEAGTVKMATNLNVDLRELFVMPRVKERPRAAEAGAGGSPDPASLMDLAAARRFFGVRAEAGDGKKSEGDEKGVAALEQVKRAARNVIIGAPGGGKSTFLEWLQLKLASVEEVLEMNGEQAIPLLLRMRQLDAKKLPRGAALIERATNSRDRAALMPQGWIERQMRRGHVLFMLDGLDETEPRLRDRYVLPWLTELCEQYPACRFLVSSRPVGYAAGALEELNFVECDLLDFGEPEVAEYTRHWCTAVRLAQNEPEEEARREGEVDGRKIVEGFVGHQYIPTLARNPLMLSAICLVNYFERGELPKDRAKLYRLCVEGLLHNWDQRRGIKSEFGLDEKLRACREVAIAMQTDGLAEYEAAKVRRIFTKALGDAARARKLLEHIRYRTGLLLERRAGIFAFAHLTFQEYLAALAVHEGNLLNIDAEQLARDHHDGRWNEVIALYCGIAPVSAARHMIELLIAQQDTQQLSTVLAEAFLSSSTVITKDGRLRRKVLERIAIAPSKMLSPTLARFSPEEVKEIANVNVGKKSSGASFSEALLWLQNNKNLTDFKYLLDRLSKWRELKGYDITELTFLVHYAAPDSLLGEIVDDLELYRSTEGGAVFKTAGAAFLGLALRGASAQPPSIEVERAFLQILRAANETEEVLAGGGVSLHLAITMSRLTESLPTNSSTWPEFATLTRNFVSRLKTTSRNKNEEPVKAFISSNEGAIKALSLWADKLENAIAAKAAHGAKAKSPKKNSKKAAKKAAKRRR